MVCVSVFDYMYIFKQIFIMAFPQSNINCTGENVNEMKQTTSMK